ncbi:uncharacterized protein LOC106468829 [Limulus polyphemus]|uniref:Uncharacterized protein LOC106468829 n=1 Tax=Limulus polyphemus TaxID=6850 RepID=A0ABM1BM22_LIMPO|nr:uncharacterized protein LOC106468829 [Limulus polyphemus]
MIDETAPHPPFHHKTRMQIRRVLNDKNRKKRKGNHHKHIMNGHFYNGKELKSHKKGSQGKINTDLKPHKAAILRFNLPTSISEISEVEDGSPKNENHSYSNVVFTQDDEGITFTAPTPLSESDVDILSSDFNRISHPTKEFRPLTLTETTLPWKREENCTDRSCVQKQQEFPPWVENKEYHAYSSLTKTFLGKINPNSDIKPPNVFAVFGIEKPIKDEEVNMKNGNTKTVDSFISQTENADTASVEDGYFLNQIQPENFKEEQFEMKKQNTGVQASLCTGVNDERENSSQVEEPHDFVIDMSDQKGLISKRL